MSEVPNPNNPEEETQPIVYASPVKRTWAWVAVVYMILFTATFTYYLATTELVGGLSHLMVAPAFGGVTATAIFRHRSGNHRGGLVACLIIVIFSLVMMIDCLVVGIPLLLASLGVT